jgi:hypothetical protein
MLEIYNTDFDITVGSARLFNNAKQGSKLTVDGRRWMIYNQSIKDHLHLFSSYELAYGNCILTGLGTGVLSNWLTINPRVTSITVFEISKDVIELNRQLGLLDNPKIRVINSPAQQIENVECDCLLLDHYELESEESIIEDVKNVASKIKHKLLWFYPAERFINIQYRQDVKKSIVDVYQQWVKDNGLNNMPEFSSEEQLKMFINLFFNTSTCVSARKRKDFPHIYNL